MTTAKSVVNKRREKGSGKGSDLQRRPTGVRADAITDEVVKDIQELFAVDSGKEKRLTRFTTYRATLPPTAQEVKALRVKLHLSQSGFAKTINVAVKTVQNWEQGDRNPDGTAVTLLWLLDRHAGVVLPLVKELATHERTFHLKEKVVSVEGVI